MSERGIITGPEELTSERVKKSRRFGGASCFSGCLSLQSGFVSICFWSFVWSFLLLFLYSAVWQLVSYSDWIVDLVARFLRDDGYASRRVEFTKSIIDDFEVWAWWSTWVEGLILFAAGLLGAWGLGGCCMGSTARRLRQNNLILASCWLLFVQWIMGSCIIISFPIWLKVSKGISIFSWWRALCYVFLLVLPVFSGGFWMLDAAFSFYYVLKAGGTGLEMKSANEIKKEKDLHDDLVDDLDELRVRQPLIHRRNFTPEGFEPVFSEDLESLGNSFDNPDMPIMKIGVVRKSTDP